MIKEIRKEGEYPFYPIKPEHPVMNPAKAMLLADEETGEQRYVIDYSANNFQDAQGQ